MMNNISGIFDDLMISSPNEHGGLFYTFDCKTYLIDKKSLTGIFCTKDRFLKSIQPDRVKVYSEKYSRELTDNCIDDIHDFIEYKNSFYTVGTMNNSVVKLDAHLNVVQSWIFDGELDSMHINCIGVLNDRIIYSAFGDFSQHRGYKGNTYGAGYVAYLDTGEKIIEGLSQPHSIYVTDDLIIVANSECKEIRFYDLYGKLIKTLFLDGYTRGISVRNDIVFVGLSCSRNSKNNVNENASVVALCLKEMQEIDRFSLSSKEIYSIIDVSNILIFKRLLLEHLEEMYEDNVNMEKMLNTKMKYLENEREINNKLAKEIKYKTDELELIKGSKAWKVIALLRTVFNKVKFK